MDSCRPHQPPYFPALTGLRAIAAYMVFFYHNPIAAAANHPWIASIFGEGYLGVNLFFVLSGLLIYTRYHAYPFHEKGRYWGFLRNRFARIYPLFFLLTTATFLYHRHSNNDITTHQPLLAYFMNISLIKGYFKSYYLSGIMQTWTLTVEATFYLCTPLLLQLFKRPPLILLVIISCYLIGFAVWWQWGSNNNGGFFADLSFIYYSTFLGRCTDFFAGMFVGYCWQKQLRIKGFISYKTAKGCLLFVGIVAVQITVKGNWLSAVQSNWGLIINNILMPIAIALMFWGLITERGYFQIWLSSKPFQLLGESSYSFYLIHLGLISGALHRYCISNFTLQFIPLVLVAYGLYSFVEKPLNGWLRG